MLQNVKCFKGDDEVLEGGLGESVLQTKNKLIIHK